MKTVSRKSQSRVVRDDYLDLVRSFPLRQIRSAREHAAAMKVLDPLLTRSTRVPSDLSDGESDYLGALAVLIHAYEAPMRAKIVAGITPLDRLEHYMDARGMKAKDLAEHVGGKSAASLILNGKRQISREQAKSLAALFAVDAGEFL